MDINLEKISRHSIQAYDNSQVMINNIQYHDNIIISNQQLTHPWLVDSSSPLTMTQLQPLLEFNPEVILIGHNLTRLMLDPIALNELSKQRIGIECISIGAACRTFNILLNESRNVALGLIF